jgi:hypothetical protein
VKRNDCKLTSNPETRASSRSGDVVVEATKLIACMAFFLTWFDLKVNVTKPMDHCDDPGAGAFFFTCYSSISSLSVLSLADSEPVDGGFSLFSTATFATALPSLLTYSPCSAA